MLHARSLDLKDELVRMRIGKLVRRRYCYENNIFPLSASNIQE